MKHLLITNDNLETLYLEYHNNYLSIAAFAMAKNLNEAVAKAIIKAGRRINWSKK